MCPEVSLAAKQRNDSLSKESGCATLSYIAEGIVFNEILRVKVLLCLCCGVRTDQKLF